MEIWEMDGEKALGLTVFRLLFTVSIGTWEVLKGICWQF